MLEEKQADGIDQHELVNQGRVHLMHGGCDKGPVAVACERDVLEAVSVYNLDKAVGHLQKRDFFLRLEPGPRCVGSSP